MQNAYKHQRVQAMVPTGQTGWVGLFASTKAGNDGEWTWAHSMVTVAETGFSNWAGGHGAAVTGNNVISCGYLTGGGAD